MDIKDIIQQGEDAKYKVTIDREGFSMNDNNFRIKLRWGLMGHSLTITKDEMFSSENDEWFFTFNTDGMFGRVLAECFYDVPDDDFEDKFRTEVNRQYLCFVVTLPLPLTICCPPAPSQDEAVTYERIGESNVAELYAYLVDCNGTNMATTDGERLMVLKRRR